MKNAFLLRIVDHDNKRYWIEGPMTDDTALNEAVVRTQESGRHVRCSSVPSTDTTHPDLRYEGYERAPVGLA